MRNWKSGVSTDVDIDLAVTKGYILVAQGEEIKNT